MQIRERKRKRKRQRIITNSFTNVECINNVIITRIPTLSLNLYRYFFCECKNTKSERKIKLKREIARGRRTERHTHIPEYTLLLYLLRIVSSILCAWVCMSMCECTQNSPAIAILSQIHFAVVSALLEFGFHFFSFASPSQLYEESVFCAHSHSAFHLFKSSVFPLYFLLQPHFHSTSLGQHLSSLAHIFSKVFFLFFCCRCCHCFYYTLLLLLLFYFFHIFVWLMLG